MPTKRQGKWTPHLNNAPQSKPMYVDIDVGIDAMASEIENCARFLFLTHTFWKHAFSPAFLLHCFSVCEQHQIPLWPAHVQRLSPFPAIARHSERFYCTLNPALLRNT